MATAAGIAAVALVVGLVLRHYSKIPKAVLPCFLVAGLGLTGVLGTFLDRAAPTLAGLVGSLTAWALGAAVPIALLIVMVIALWAHQGSGSTAKTACVVAFLFFPICAAVGGVGGWLATNATNLLAQAGPAVASFLNGLGA